MKQFVLIAFLTVLAGCGDSEGQGLGNQDLTLAPVSGVVSLDGTPMDAVLVTFYTPSGVVGVATTDSEGKFTMMTNGKEGVSVGECKVTLVDQRAPKPSAPGMPELLTAEISRTGPTIAAKYGDQQSSDLTVTVTEAGDQNVVLDVTADK